MATRNDACSHADLYTGLQGVVAIQAALNHRARTGSGQHVDVSMAATMLSVNERAGAQMSGIDTQGEPYALSATESHIFVLPNGDQLTIAASPLFTPIFGRFCAMMRRSDLLLDSRFATPLLRKKHLPALLEEVRAWLLTFCLPKAEAPHLVASFNDASIADQCGSLRVTMSRYRKRPPRVLFTHIFTTVYTSLWDRTEFEPGPDGRVAQPLRARKGADGSATCVSASIDRLK